MNDEWRTPPDLFTALNWRFGPYDVDVACNDDNCLCQFGCNPENEIDGLRANWSDVYKGIDLNRPIKAWMNPPYSMGQINQWVKKAYEEAKHNGVQVTGLIRLDPSTQWWQKYVQPAGHILFLDRRVKFIDPDTGKPGGSAPSPHCVVCWDREHRWFDLKRTICETWGWSSATDRFI